MRARPPAARLNILCGQSMRRQRNQYRAPEVCEEQPPTDPARNDVRQ